MDKTTFEALQQVINYLWKDEQKDWDASSRPKNHVFEKMIIVNTWVQEVEKDYAELTTHD